ncbi:hypothetical protein HK105_200198 [Polyrhizophydium stewartii]|uniref:Cytochrome P450 n=1 Tax=Polyrhizophydium stewartii TaxID=2732419 RepID=A0ABR4NKS4_9FUNG
MRVHVVANTLLLELLERRNHACEDAERTETTRAINMGMQALANMCTANPAVQTLVWPFFAAESQLLSTFLLLAEPAAAKYALVWIHNCTVDSPANCVALVDSTPGADAVASMLKMFSDEADDNDANFNLCFACIKTLLLADLAPRIWTQLDKIEDTDMSNAHVALLKALDGLANPASGARLDAGEVVHRSAAPGSKAMPQVSGTCPKSRTPVAHARLPTHPSPAMPATVSAIVPKRANKGLVGLILEILAKRPRWSSAVLLLAFLLVRNYNQAIGSYPRVSNSVMRTLDSFTASLKKANFKTVVATAPFIGPTFLVSDPKSVEYVLRTNFDNFVKGKFFDVRMHELLGSGIFNSDGEHWRIQRKSAATIFTTRGFRLYVETIFANEMKMLAAKLQDAAASGKTIDMQTHFFRFTLDSFGLIGFGTELNTMSKESVPFAVAFDRIQNIINYRFTSPFWWIEELLNFSAYRQFQEDRKLIRSFGQSIISQRRAEPEEIRSKRSDLLTLLMSMTIDDAGRKYTDDELCDHVLNFIIAGRDTTAQALSWTFYRLSLNPEARQKLVAEIDATLGDATYPTYEQVKGMKYANAVFSEALRLSPSVPKNGKTAVNDCVLPDGTPIPAGAQVGWYTYGMARNPAVWGPDAEEFRPERWLNERIRTQYENMSFNAGPRICLGKALAELEGVFVLVSILRLFDVEAVDPKAVTYKNTLTLPIKGELECRVVQRRAI